MEMTPIVILSSRSPSRRTPVHCRGHGAGDFGYSISNLYARSRRAEPKEKWIWLPKPALFGEVGYPARPEEIQRQGWQARHSRVQPPPPLVKTFAQAASSDDMPRDSFAPSRSNKQGAAQEKI